MTVPRSLAIVGSHPDTRENAPFDDPDYDIWLFNEAAQKPEVYPRWDAVLQIHLEEVYSSTTNWVNLDHWEWLQKDHGDKRIFMQDVDPRVPNSVRYPIEGVRALLPTKFKYLRSSPAMALALAIYLGYPRIELYGSDLISNTEYTYQAINYAFWIGFALGQGIDLDLQCWHNEFYHQPLYGYEGELQIDAVYFEKVYEQQRAVWEIKNNALKKLQSKLDDAMIDAKHAKVGELSLAVENCLINTGEAYGAMNEAKRYAERTDPISRQEFERVAAQARLDGEMHEKDMNFSAGKCEYVWNVWTQTGAFEALKQLRVFLAEKEGYATRMGKALGVFRENIAYQAEYDQRITAAGGARAVHQVKGGNGKS
jgi:hypothetical protein